MTATAYTPLLMTAAIAFAYYRRIRGSFGRQPWRPVRTGLRLGLLALAGLMLAVAAKFVPGALAPVAAGAVVGGLLGVLAIRHTQLGWHEGQRCYTPNPWIGAALGVLLVGRLAWRMGSGALTGGAAQFGQNASPLTLGIAATLVGYYLVQGSGLVLAMRRLPRPDAPAAP
jgi:NADH:ubiquinone oxidoreductase subunit 6 (subunit J)